MDTRIAHDYTGSTHEGKGTGSFAYDVVANGTRRSHDGFTMAWRHRVRCKMYSRMCPEGITRLPDVMYKIN